MKKTTLLAATVALALSALAGAASAEAVRVGRDLEPYAPFYWKEADGSWHGFEVELLDAICAEAKLDCETVEVSWDGLIPSLTTDKIDLIVAAMSITDKRKEVIDFSEPYYSASGAFIGRKGTTTDGSPEAMTGKIIGVQNSTTYSAYAAQAYGDVATIKTYQASDEALADLGAGRLDFVIAGEIPMSERLKKEDAADLHIAGKVPASDASVQRVGMGLRKGDAELKSKIDAGIAAVLANGTYDKIAAKYFDFDIYGMPRN